MKHKIIIGIRGSRASDIDAFSVQRALATAWNNPTGEALFEGESCVALRVDTEEVNAVITSQEGVFINPFFQNLEESSMRIEAVVRGYSEDCLKDFLKDHMMKAKIRRGRPISGTRLHRQVEPTVFVAIDGSDLASLPQEDMVFFLQNILLGDNGKVLWFHKGCEIQRVARYALRYYGLQMIDSQVRTLHQWVEGMPLYADNVKVTVNQSVRELRQLTYLLSGMGSEVSLVRDARDIVDDKSGGRATSVA